MADYWKSQPRKFCQYCKCWIADNKPSIEFHERGKNHKQNVTAKIEEIKKKSIDKAKKEEKMSKEFAAMEEAAMKAYQEDMKRLQAESGASEVPSRVGPSGLPSRVGPSGLPSRVGPSGLPSRVGPSGPPSRVGPSGPPSRVGPSGLPSRVGASKFSSKRKTQKSEVKVTTVTYTSSESDAWLQGTTDDGVIYYYNTLTGESQWEKPEGFQGESVSPSTQQTEQASSGSAWMEAVSPDGYTYYYNTETGESSWEKPAEYSPAEESPGKESPAEESPEQETAEQQVSSTPQPESLSGEDDSPEVQTDTTGEPEEKEPRVPKISFRKRTEKTQGEEKSDEKSDEGTEEEKDNQTVESSRPAEDKEIPAKKARKATPYGEWAQIQEEEDPYDKIDLQLPQTEGGATSSTTSDLPPVPKAKFKERTITTLGDEYSSETTFKKRKTENGKSRRLRQRGKDD